MSFKEEYGYPIWIPIAGTALLIAGPASIVMAFYTMNIRWFLATLVVVILLGLPAKAHDPVTGQSNWIEKNGYRGTDNIGCCGPNDCERLAPEEIEPRRDGFFLKRFNELVPFSEATPSEDSFSWRCHKSYSRSERRCFFFRYGSS